MLEIKSSHVAERDASSYGGSCHHLKLNRLWEVPGFVRMSWSQRRKLIHFTRKGLRNPKPTVRSGRERCVFLWWELPPIRWPKPTDLEVNLLDVGGVDASRRGEREGSNNRPFILLPPHHL